MSNIIFFILFMNTVLTKPYLLVPHLFNFTSSQALPILVQSMPDVFFLSLFSLKSDLPGFIFHDTLSVCITLIQHPHCSLRILGCQATYLWRNSANSVLHQASQARRHFFVTNPVDSRLKNGLVGRENQGSLLVWNSDPRLMWSNLTRAGV